MVRCPACTSFVFVNISKLLREKKFICPECKQKSDLSKLKVMKDVNSFICLFFKIFAEPYKNEDNEVVFTDKLTISARIEYKKEFDKLVDVIKSARIAWNIEEPKEGYITIKICPKCAICKNCNKIVKLNDTIDGKLCSECNEQNYKYLIVKGDTCPNCSNKNLIEENKKVIQTIVSVKHIRKMFYDKSQNILKL